MEYVPKLFCFKILKINVKHLFVLFKTWYYNKTESVYFNKYDIIYGIAIEYQYTTY